MHDFHLANEIMNIAKEYAQKNNLTRISKVKIELGDIIEHGENISPENLKYNINLLIPCDIEIKKIKGDTWKLVSIEGN